MALTVPPAVWRTLFPRARLGYCLRHALNKLPSKLIGLSATVRKGLRSQFHSLLHRCRQRKSLRVVALGQRLRHFADHIATTVGVEHGERVRKLVPGEESRVVCGARRPTDASQ